MSYDVLRILLFTYQVFAVLLLRLFTRAAYATIVRASDSHLFLHKFCFVVELKYTTFCYITNYTFIYYHYASH